MTGPGRVTPTRVTLNRNMHTYTHGKVKQKYSSNIILPARADQAFSHGIPSISLQTPHYALIYKALFHMFPLDKGRFL